VVGQRGRGVHGRHRTGGIELSSIVVLNPIQLQ
jgi:hypothetical protein